MFFLLFGGGLGVEGGGMGWGWIVKSTVTKSSASNDKEQVIYHILDTFNRDKRLAESHFADR